MTVVIAIVAAAAVILLVLVALLACYYKMKLRKRDVEDQTKASANQQA